MRDYLPILIVGAIIGVFSLFFVIAYALEKNKKERLTVVRKDPDGRTIHL